jgi:C4-type Zn-finger protein
MDNKSVKGIVSELQVATEYMKQGYQVSKSLNPQCPFDLVITDEQGNSFLIDVKTISRRKNRSSRSPAGSKINRILTKKQKDMKIILHEHNYEME